MLREDECQTETQDATEAIIIESSCIIHLCITLFGTIAKSLRGTSVSHYLVVTGSPSNRPSTIEWNILADK